ncbi:GNAT family N-acetyltransferase [Paenibacillus sp. 598K]|uniref:GNAT family N-acetyltransferase n=1 Tax=Paenibacillus sp. 598K TaxID=1117987 RepID=UPI000FF9F1C8|nr:GNAT family N-acetyltransferase [Paenibacillus sp. 598K]GBF74455.1 GNAT family N-acetyltransferase [Paenibacillus sp. 598K]
MVEGVVHLRPITKDNESECIKLKPSKNQEDLVATNADSIIHATKEPTSKPYGIYSNDTMVGFLLFDNEIYKDGYYWILRFMVDEQYQHKGYGTLAIKEVIKMLSAKPDCKQIRVNHVPHNTAANRLYKSLGFQETGEMEDGEVVLSYAVK